MGFKAWLRTIERSTLEGLTAGQDPPLGDIARSYFIIGGDADGGCLDLPMGVRSMCKKPTSAFKTYTLTKKMKMKTK